MFSVTVILTFLLFCLPLISGKVHCKSGERVYVKDLIYDCVDGRKVYYGCKIGGVEFKQNTTKDEGNLRRHLCFKQYNDVRPNVVIGCVTDDNIFIDETKTVIQKDGTKFACIKNGKNFSLTKTPKKIHSPTHSPSVGCKLGQKKLIAHQFVIECQKNEWESQNTFHLIACYQQPKYANDKMKRIRIEARKTFDKISNKAMGLGLRYKCHERDDKYFYDQIGCIVGKDFINPDDLFLNETAAILCVQEKPGKLHLKHFSPKKIAEKVCPKSVEIPSDDKVIAKKQCPNSWILNEKTGFCYKVFDNANFDDAKKKCETENSTLTSVHSFEEAQFIANLSHTPEGETWHWKFQAWIGLYTSENSVEWKWLDGTPMDYNKWAKNEPDDLDRQKCGYIRVTPSSTIVTADKGDFQNILCTEVLSKFVCKKASL